ncbi:MAG: hypothetical protein H0W44_09980 [Gammaproteobacteria bacterium]|nr:hypothetical protein [Gammaproteobacteria bacterium]
MRLIIFFIGILLILWSLRGLIRQLRGDAAHSSEPQSPAAPNKPSSPPRGKPIGESMVLCSFCSLHIPESEALRTQDRFFCCDAHRQQWLLR